MNPILIGPFTQLLTMDRLPPKGPLRDEQLEIIPQAGIVIDGTAIQKIGRFDSLRLNYPHIREVPGPSVVLPAFIDSHTHLCWAGSRAQDYALRLGGSSYQEIAAAGGGILETVRKTRAASKHELVDLLKKRCERLRTQGVATCEVKSGYGLSVEEEIKILEAVRESSGHHGVELIPTCLAAHAKPWEFRTCKEYLDYLMENLIPRLVQDKLTKRIDIFVEEGAFSVDEARPYLQQAKRLGFSLCIHADQFTEGGARLAGELHALSADHLEVTGEASAAALKAGGVIPIVLPGASLGLGHPFPPARMLLDAKLGLVIASDWNPGSAPMGHLLMQAAVLGAAQHLSMAETLAAITVRAAKALELDDRGTIAPGKKGDLAVFPCADYREILYNQGALLPDKIR